MQTGSTSTNVTASSITDHRRPNAPLVTIGVPVYNGARFIRGALESLLAQTLTDFELLISDNASSDATQAICEEYAARDARIRYVRQQTNIGAPRNWNFLVTQARGEYFKWATANDECAPTLLEHCVAVLRSDAGAVLAQGLTFLVDEESGARRPYSGDLALIEPRAVDRVIRLCMKLELNNGQSGVIRRSALLATRLDRLYPGGDFVLMAELAMLGKFIVLPDALLYRRMGPSTFSRALRGEREREFYDPSAARPWPGRKLRIHLDFMRSIATSSMPIRDKGRAFDIALRRMYWDRPLSFGRPRNEGRRSQGQVSHNQSSQAP